MEDINAKCISPFLPFPFSPNVSSPLSQILPNTERKNEKSGGHRSPRALRVSVISDELFPTQPTTAAASESAARFP